jgi:hypothetical protein
MKKFIIIFSTIILILYSFGNAHATLILVDHYGGDTFTPEDPVVVLNGLTDGALSYVDRPDAFWTDLPAYLDGIDYIMTENDDKSWYDERFVISVTCPSLLNIFVDQRVLNTMSAEDSRLTWLTNDDVVAGGFTKSSEIILQEWGDPWIYGEYPFDVWTASVSPGEYIIRDQFSHQVGSMFGIAASAAPIPEPATMLLFGSGLIGLIGFRRKLRKK